MIGPLRRCICANERLSGREGGRGGPTRMQGCRNINDGMTRAKARYGCLGVLAIRHSDGGRTIKRDIIADLNLHRQSPL